jgi:hypothetical protein
MITLAQRTMHGRRVFDVHQFLFRFDRPFFLLAAELNLEPLFRLIVNNFLLQNFHIPHFTFRIPPSEFNLVGIGFQHRQKG